MNSMSLNPQGRGRASCPAAHPILLLLIPVTTTLGQLGHCLIHQLAIESTERTRNRVQHRLQTLLVQELIHTSALKFFCCQGSKCNSSPTCHCLQVLSSALHTSTPWPPCQISRHNYRAETRPASFQERKKKKLKF